MICLSVFIKESVRSHRVTRFYLQHKDDPHGPSVSLFVGNLPPGPRTEKQYEKILFQDIFKNDKDLKWDKMDVIYYEHGAMVLVYNDSDRATRAFTKLRQAYHDQKQLLVLMLPNIQPQVIPTHISPLLVFVNVKSGGQQGAELISASSIRSAKWRTIARPICFSKYTLLSYISMWRRWNSRLGIELFG